MSFSNKSVINTSLIIEEALSFDFIPLLNFNKVNASQYYFLNLELIE